MSAADYAAKVKAAEDQAATTGEFDVPPLSLDDAPQPAPAAPADGVPPMLARPPEETPYAKHVEERLKADESIPSQPPADIPQAQKLQNSEDALNKAFAAGQITKEQLADGLAPIAAQKGAAKVAAVTPPEDHSPSTWDAIKRGANSFIDKQKRYAQAIAAYETFGAVPFPAQASAAPAAPAPAGDTSAGPPVVATPRAPAPEDVGGSGTRTASVVPAHEQPIVDPRRQAELAATYPHEAAAELHAADVEAQAHEAAAEEMRNAIADAQRNQQAMLEDRAARERMVGQMLQDAHSAARDVASRKIDPDRFWKNRTTGQKILFAIGAALGGFAHDHTAAQTIMHLVDQDTEAQRFDIENGQKAAQDKMSMFHAALQATNSMDLAQQQDIATKLNYSMMKVREQAEESQAPIVRARAQALLAQLERKQIEVGIAMNKYVPAQAVTAGAGPGLGSGAPLEVAGQMQIVPLPDGKQVLIPRGGEAVASSVAVSLRAAEEAKELSALMKQMPSAADYGQFKQWNAMVDAKIKALSQLDAPHLGMGSRGSLGMFRNIQAAIDANQGKERSYASNAWDMSLSGWRAEAIKKNAETLSRQAVLDADRLIAEHNGIVGTQDTQTYPGKRGQPDTSKIVFYPRSMYRSGTLSNIAGVGPRPAVPTEAMPLAPPKPGGP